MPGLSRRQFLVRASALAASTGANVTFVVAAQVIRVFMMLFAVPVGAKVVQRYRK